MKKSEQKMKLDISVTTQLNIPTVVMLSIDKIGVKRVLDIIRYQCLETAFDRAHFPSSLFATKKDEEMANVAAALIFLKHNWEHCCNKGMKIIEKSIKKANKET